MFLRVNVEKCGIRSFFLEHKRKIFKKKKLEGK